MRFVMHCALLLLAFFGLASVLDRWTAPPPDDDLVGLSVGQLQSSDDAYVALRQAERAKNLFFMKPLMLLAVGLAAVAVCRPGLLSRRSKALAIRSGLARKGGVV
jgi:hypothetical protein